MDVLKRGGGSLIYVERAGLGVRQRERRRGWTRTTSNPAPRRELPGRSKPLGVTSHFAAQVRRHEMLDEAGKALGRCRLLGHSKTVDAPKTCTYAEAPPRVGGQAARAIERPFVKFPDR